MYHTCTHLPYWSLTGCTQAHGAQSDTGSGGKKSQVDNHAAAEGPQTQLRQVRGQLHEVRTRWH